MVPFRSAFAFRAPLGVTAVQLCTLQSVSAVLHRSVRDYDDRIPSQLDSSERAAQGHVKILYRVRYSIVDTRTTPQPVMIESTDNHAAVQLW